MTHSAEGDSPHLDGLTKGIPGDARALPLAEIGARGWNILREDLPLPVAVLKDSALRHNERWMMAAVQGTGGLIAPHGKTTMSPELFRRQLDGGAWAMTVATVHQLQVCRRFGFDRVVLANQLVGRQAIRYVLDELAADPQFEFFCLVDSTDGVALLERAAREREPGRPLNVFVEGGVAGGRTGCRTLDGALEVARAVKAASPHLALRGVEGFEGLIEGETPAAQEAAITRFLEYLVTVAEACDREALFEAEPVYLSAGGSAFYDIVLDVFSRARLERRTQILTRSGCYITHDSAMYERAFSGVRRRSLLPALPDQGPRPALEVWAYVQSRPEPDKAILTLGRRDASHDADLPRPLRWFRPGDATGGPEPLSDGHTVTALNDQHAHVALPPGSPLRIGDMVALGISHPCTTFDKWRVLFVVDDDYTVVSAVQTFF